MITHLCVYLGFAFGAVKLVETESENRDGDQQHRVLALDDSDFRSLTGVYLVDIQHLCEEDEWEL